MIFDNADSVVDTAGSTSAPATILDDYWPVGSRGSVLITTRDRASLGLFHGHVSMIECLAEDDAANLLLSLTRPHSSEMVNEHARLICEQVGYLPLAISSVALIVQQDNMSLQEYIKDFSYGEMFELSQPFGGPADSYPHRISTTWNRHMDRLDADALSLINMFAFLDNDRIPDDLLLKAANDPTNKLLIFISNAKVFRQIRRNLRRGILVEHNEDLERMYMHRMVQEFCIFRMDENAYRRAFEMAFSVLDSQWPFQDHINRYNLKQWPMQQELISHIEALASRLEKSQEHNSKHKGWTNKELSVVHSRIARLFHSGAWYVHLCQGIIGAWLTQC